MNIVYRRTSLEHNRSLRADRQSNRGKISYPSFGLYTDRRRYALERIVALTPTANLTVGTVRRRMRKNWTLSESVTIAG